MADFNVRIDDSVIKNLYRIGERADEIAQMILDDAGQLVADELEAEIRSKHNDTGDLAASIYLKVYKNTDGVWVAWAYPEGRARKKRSKGKVYARSKHNTMSSGRTLYNTDKLWWIEHGTSKQPARPFMDAMIKNIEGKVISRMQEVFEREVGV